jgi:hypothetical protein
MCRRNCRVFVSITKDKKKDWYQLKYEKLPLFCGACGLLGHWYQECGTGEHDVKKLEWGDFMLADGGRGRGRGWSAGHDPSGGRGMRGGREHSDGRVPMGRGRGRSATSTGTAIQPWVADNASRDEEMADIINGRKRVTTDGASSGGIGEMSKNPMVAEIINQLEPGKSLAVLGSPEKIQAPKRSRKGEETHNQTLSATSDTEVVREQ